MLISCEKCSTTYVLDDALIPPQGAPVQCTRCGHVFTARVGGALAPEAKAPAPPPAPRPPAASTQMFGAVAPPSQSSQAPAPRGSETMVFGTAASNAAAQSPAQPATVGKTTMMFGTGSPPPEPASTPTATSSKATMVFGAVAAPAKAPPTFGTAASNAIADPATTPQSALPAKNQTMVMFGAAAGAAAPAAPPPAATPVNRTTIMFGTPASAVAAHAPAPAPSPSAAPSQTLVFGAAAAPPPKPKPGSNAKTQTFGAYVASSDSAETPVTSTSPTQKFPAGSKTMMFGRDPSEPVTPPDGVPLPKDATIRVPAAEFEGDDGQPSARHDRTQRFAMSEVAGDPGAMADTPVPSVPSVEEPPTENGRGHNRTQLFAMSSPTPPPTAPKVDLNKTLPPDTVAGLLLDDPAGVSVLHDPANPQSADTPVPSRPVVTTLPGVAAHQPAAEKPKSAKAAAPRPVAAPQEVDPSSEQTALAEDLDEASLKAVRSGGAGRVVVVVLALLAVVLLGILITRLFR